jgi:nuclear transport factor 2 (NTF2) superfamily protein
VRFPRFLFPPMRSDGLPVPRLLLLTLPTRSGAFFSLFSFLRITVLLFPHSLPNPCAFVARWYDTDSPSPYRRNRDQFFQGREAIQDFLEKKWEKEKEYKLKKTLFSYTDNRIAVNFWYEFFDKASQGWRRTYGLEHWFVFFCSFFCPSTAEQPHHRTFADDGLMKKRHMSGNEVAIKESERWFKDGVDVDSVHIADRDG